MRTHLAIPFPLKPSGDRGQMIRDKLNSLFVALVTARGIFDPETKRVITPDMAAWTIVEAKSSWNGGHMVVGDVLIRAEYKSNGWTLPLALFTLTPSDAVTGHRIDVTGRRCGEVAHLAEPGPEPEMSAEAREGYRHAFQVGLARAEVHPPGFKGSAVERGPSRSRQEIIDAIREGRGSIAAAARALDIHYDVLNGWIRVDPGLAEVRLAAFGEEATAPSPAASVERFYCDGSRCGERPIGISCVGYPYHCTAGRTAGASAPDLQLDAKPAPPCESCTPCAPTPEAFDPVAAWGQVAKAWMRCAYVWAELPVQLMLYHRVGVGL